MKLKTKMKKYKKIVGIVSPPYQDSQIIQLKAGMGKDMHLHEGKIEIMEIEVK